MGADVSENPPADVVAELTAAARALRDSEIRHRAELARIEADHRAVQKRYADALTAFNHAAAPRPESK